MDYISSPNIFSIASCNLSTKLLGRCHSDWSKTNLISIVTQAGIYILQPNLERADQPFDIDFIRNPSDKFKHEPLEKNKISLESIWSSMDNQQYIETFLNPVLLTSVPKLSSESYPRRFRSANWSPVIRTFPAACLLTTITLDFQLEIYAIEDGVWQVKENLSQIYDQMWMETSLAGSVFGKSLNGIGNTLHSLSFGTVLWKDHDTMNPILLSSTLTGEIVVWIVSISGRDESLCPSLQRDKLQFDVQYIIRTNQESIGAMHLYKNLLVTTSQNGQVDLYDLSVIFDEIEARPRMQQVQSNIKLGPLLITEMPPTAILWHHDNIEVMDFYLQSLTQDTFRIVLTKSTNICWCTIHYKPQNADEQAILAISDTFSAINGLDPEVSLHQTPATWLKPAGGSKAVLVADDGSFFQLDFIDDRHDTSPSFNAIRTGKIDLTDMIPRGLCTSPTGALITMISCVTYLVDPLKIPAPTKLITLPTINERKFFIDCMSNLLDENWLSANNVTSPMDVCDRIDCMRSMFPQLNTYQFDRLRMMLKDEISQLGYPKNSTQLVMLKIINFLLMKLGDPDDPTPIDDITELDLEQNVENIIFLDSVEKTLSAIFADDGCYQDEMSESQVRSLRNTFQWLETSYNGNSIRDRYSQRYNELMDKYHGVQHEICSICQQEIPFKNHKYGSCKNNHNFLRCSRSLLVLSMSGENTFLQCSDCKRNYLTRLVWPTESHWLCLYCQ